MAMEGKSLAEQLDNSLMGGPTEEEIMSVRKCWESDQDSDLLRFQYASVLARSAVEQDRLESLLHLEFLVGNHKSTGYLRDALYLMTVLKYVMGDFEQARGYAEELCRIDPDNPQVKNLFIAIRYKHEKQSKEIKQRRRHQQEEVGWAVGLGMGLAALGVGVALALTKSRK